MTADEKTQATAIVHRFAYLAAKKRMSVGDVARLNNSLTGGRSVTSEELRSMNLSTNHLRKWVAKVDQSTKHLMKPGEAASVAGEIRKLFIPTLKSSPTKTAGHATSTGQSNQNGRSKEQSPTYSFPEDMIPDGITPSDIEQFKSGLTPEQRKQLEARINGVR